MVNTEDYKAILDKAVEELKALSARQDEIADEWEVIGNRIAEVKQGILALAPLCGIQAHRKYAELFPEYDPFAPVGLNEAILTVLDRVEDDRYITPVAIRDGLKATGYEIKSKNILPSIHNVLKRLDGQRVESGDVNGKTGYRLIKAGRPRHPSPYARLKNPFRDFAESLNKAKTPDEFLKAVTNARKTD